MTAHYVYNFMQAWEDYHAERPIQSTSQRLAQMGNGCRMQRFL